MDLQQKHTPPGKKVVNTLQTNGVLLDDAWCEFFKANEFLIGLSIDGPADLHDRYRYDKKGRPTFAAVHAGLKLLKKHAVEFNALVVVNRHNGEHGKKVYTYLRDNGVQVHAVHSDRRRTRRRRARGNGPMTRGTRQLTVRAAGTIRRLHDRSLRGMGPPRCGHGVRAVVRSIAVRVDGAGSEPVHLSPSNAAARWPSNTTATSTAAITSSSRSITSATFATCRLSRWRIPNGNVNFGAAKENGAARVIAVNAKSASSATAAARRTASSKRPTAKPDLNYLCAGYRKFFNFIDPYMKRMATELKARRPAANIMRMLKVERQGRAVEPARDPRQLSRPQHPGGNPPGRNDRLSVWFGAEVQEVLFGSRVMGLVK